jgi:hypothetical protein
MWGLGSPMGGLGILGGPNTSSNCSSASWRAAAASSRFCRLASASESRLFLPPMSQAFNDSEPELAVGAGMGSSEKPSPGSAPRPMSAHTGSADGMVATISDGTDVWVTVPASPPLRMTIRACLNDRCAECRLPVYRCESEAGQMLRLCASHLRLLN